jgi:hypothetical protein
MYLNALFLVFNAIKLEANPNKECTANTAKIIQKHRVRHVHVNNLCMLLVKPGAMASKFMHGL